MKQLLIALSLLISPSMAGDSKPKYDEFYSIFVPSDGITHSVSPAIADHCLNDLGCDDAPKPCKYGCANPQPQTNGEVPGICVCKQKPKHLTTQWLIPSMPLDGTLDIKIMISSGSVRSVQLGLRSDGVVVWR